ncbi:arylamine N-acetyltransferase family protein [Streptomyces roseicoloratus]|uniref:Arylamine N-acetyltransferase n=1 Tax=Streptomyces roseicoloratus TaxID=2508722 RepID=A0ABY9S234_9ACTN|nr:arylamine N-acetyltransferase [Streptomyces roseicoloratus]WMX48302.1 arylamine N-acetyltransferase [Streptomyces roseicoloratus]
MTMDLDAYFARIGWSGERRPTLDVLTSVHRAHITGIPFENLDPVLGRAPSLALPDLEAKLVHGDRGGYCYEHNTLLGTVLRALGFEVTLLTARVLVGARPGDVRPRTHMLMLTRVPGEPVPYVTDVGFGSIGSLLEPIPLADGAELHDAPRHHRLVRAAHDGPLETWTLQAHGAETEGWDDQYAFTVEPFRQPDYEVINWYIATHPRSPFARAVYAQRTTDDAHLALSGRTFTQTGADGTRKERELADADEVLTVLAEDFGILLPDGTRLPR